MRLLHLADLHLGKSLGDFDLIEDQRYILEWVLGLIDEKSVDAVLIAGDVYDKSVPSEAATRLLDFFLSSLAQKKVKTFLISGNHDSDDRLNYGSRLFTHNQIYISAKYEGKLDKYVVKDGDEEVNFYLLPFVKASQVRHYYPDSEIATYEDAVRIILENADIDEEKCNVLVAHQFVAGKGGDPTLAGSEGIATQSVGQVERIGYGLFHPFDYVALGHIHSPQSVGREEVRYSGSPLKYSLSEVDDEKSIPLITINGKNDVRIDDVPIKPMRNLRHVKGKLETLLDSSNVESTEDFIYATLTDEDMVNDVMGIFQQTYPNTVKIEYDNSHTKEIGQTDISNMVQNTSFPDLIRDFYKLIYSKDISAEEMEVMEMVAREAGVMDETN